MTMIWDRLNVSGGELLLALALADHGNEAGESIFPGIDTLSKMTRQHERTVQRQLARFRELGWLEVVADGGLVGGRGRATVYRINIAWIKGGKLPGFPDATDPAADGGNGGITPGLDPVDRPPKPRQSMPETPAMGAQKGGVRATPSVINHQDPGAASSRAIPPGSRAAPPGNESRRSHWRVFFSNHVLSECRAMQITSREVVQWRQLPSSVNLTMRAKVEDLIDWAIAAELEPISPKKPGLIEAHGYAQITMELRQFKPPTPAEQQASTEEPQFDADRGPAKRGTA